MKTDENKPNTPPEPSITRLLVEELAKRKRQLAIFLTNQSERMSPRLRKFFFLSLGITLSLAITVVSYRTARNATSFDFLHNEKVLPLQPIDEEEIVSPEEYQVLMSFYKTLDSLQQQDPFAYKKLMQSHPGIRDTMTLLIHLYQSTH